MFIHLSALIYISLYSVYVLTFIKEKGLKIEDYKALRVSFVTLTFLLTLGLIAHLPLETLIPSIDGFDQDYLRPLSLYNIDGKESLRYFAPKAWWPLSLFSLLGFTLLLLLKKVFSPRLLARCFFQDSLFIHSAISLIFFLSQYYYVFGTDHMGQDLFLQSCFAIKTGLSFAIVAMSVSMSLGLLIGLLSGWSRGLVAYILDYFYNVVNAIPSILLLILVLYFVQDWSQSFASLTSALYQQVSLFALALSLAFTQWVPLCRLVRGQVFVLREAEFIQALLMMKVGLRKIFFKHLLPHLRGLLLLTMIFDLSQYLLAEALLTFIGLGFSGDLVSFGMMINENRYAFLNTPILWWPLGAVFITLTPLVLSLNRISDYIERRSYKNKGHKDVRD